MSFIGSGTTRCRVVFYLGDRENGLTRSGGEELEFVSDPGALTDTVTSCMVQKSLSGGGSFDLTIKTEQELALFLNDDDWVDIAFTAGGREYHVMRGLIGRIEETKGVTAEGATDVTYRISGRDYGFIFEITPIWFNRFGIEEDTALGGDLGLSSSNILDLYNAINETPENTVFNLLKGFAGNLLGSDYNDTAEYEQAIANSLGPVRLSNGRLWQLPVSLPTRTPSVNFAENVQYFLGKTGAPERRSILFPQFYWPENQSLWQLAKHWSDQALGELWCDLVALDGSEPAYPYIDPQGVGAPTPISSLEMGVIYRDRPFPDTIFTGDADPEVALRAHPWFTGQYPTYVVDESYISSSNLSRSGVDRRNSFFLSPKIQAALVAGLPEFQAPEWNLKQVALHGVRRFDVTTNYVGDPDKDNLFLVSREYRNRMRDFHVLNHLFLSGTLGLVTGRPDIRIGSRLLTGARSFYVEGVSHNWNLMQGVKTQLSVTRGWVGSDQDMIRTMLAEIGDYSYAADGEGSITGVAKAARRRRVVPRRTVKREKYKGYKRIDFNQIRRDGGQQLTRAEYQAAATAAIEFLLSDTSAVATGAAAAEARLALRTSEYAAYNAANGTSIETVPTAAEQASLTLSVEWADPTTFQGNFLYQVVKHESQGLWVGIPNYLYGERKRTFAGWQEVWAGIKAGGLSGSTWIPSSSPNNGVSELGSAGLPSSATGLGQLLATNANLYYPKGVQGIGEADQEMTGLIKYILISTRADIVKEGRGSTNYAYGDPWSAYIFKFGDPKYPAGAPRALRAKPRWY